MVTISLKEFNAKEALQGASIGWANSGDPSLGLASRAYDFKSTASGFSYVVGMDTYFCNDEGVCTDGNILHSLYMVSTVISESKGTAASRGDTGTVDIDVMQPREQFAQAIIGKMVDPLNCDTSMVQQVAEKSFQFAQAMMHQAAEKRAEAGETPDDDTAIEVDSNLITSTTDKVLYNISVHLSNIYKKLDTENIQIDIKSEKVPVEIKNTAVPVSISGTPSVNVANTPSVSVANEPSVSVTNTPSVTVENTVNVTGTVKVESSEETATE